MEQIDKALETQWVPLAISNSNRKPSSVSCWRCLGVGVLLITRGHQSFAKNCLCVRRQLAKAQLAQIPPIFGRLKLSRLKPRIDLHPRQASVIGYIKVHPDESYLLVGRNGVGKSHIAWALYREAVVKQRSVVACTVRDLLAEFRRVELGAADGETLKSPRVSPEDLRRPGRRWFLFLDEFEKARPSEFAAEQLFSLLDTAMSHKHLLIVTSNLSTEQLRVHWGRASEVYGPSIMTRLQMCTLVELF